MNTKSVRMLGMVCLSILAAVLAAIALVAPAQASVYPNFWVGYNKAGTIEVHKVDEAGNPMEGVLFVLLDQEGEEIAPAYTDAEGKAIFYATPDTTYTVKEVSAPEGYDLAESKEVYVGYTEEEMEASYYYRVYCFNGERPYVLTAVNIRTENMSLDGVDLAPEALFADAPLATVNGVAATSLPGIKVRPYWDRSTLVALDDLESELGGSNKKYWLYDTDAPNWDGTAPAFTLYLDSEEQTPTRDNFALNSSNLISGSMAFESVPITVMVKNGNTEVVEFVNKPTKGSIKVAKVDADSGAALSGAEFVVEGTDEGGNKVSLSGMTGDDGTYLFDNVPFGTYTVTETKAPAGYDLASSEPQEVVLSRTESTVTEEARIELSLRGTADMVTSSSTKFAYSWNASILTTSANLLGKTATITGYDGYSEEVVLSNASGGSLADVGESLSYDPATQEGALNPYEAGSPALTINIEGLEEPVVVTGPADESGEAFSCHTNTLDGTTNYDYGLNTHGSQRYVKMVPLSVKRTSSTALELEFKNTKAQTEEKPATEPEPSAETEERTPTLATTVEFGGAQASASQYLRLENAAITGSDTVIDHIVYSGMEPGATYAVVGTLMKIENGKATEAVATKTATCVASDSGEGAWDMTFENVPLAQDCYYVVFEQATNVNESTEIVEHKNVNDKAQSISVGKGDELCGLYGSDTSDSAQKQEDTSKDEKPADDVKQAETGKTVKPAQADAKKAATPAVKSSRTSTVRTGDAAGTALAGLAVALLAGGVGLFVSKRRAKD